MDAIKFTEKLIKIKENEIYIKYFFSEENILHPPLILLHDSLGCTELWRDFPVLLVNKLNRPVICYDRLGFGKSTARHELPSIDFIKEEAEIYFPKILEFFKLDKFHLFGHSVGGSMCIEIAGKYQEQCLSVITESSQAFVEDRTIAGIIQAKNDFLDSKIFGRLEKYHGDKTKWVLSAWIDVWLSAEFKDWNLKNTLPKVKCSVLAIHGENDEYGSIAFPQMISELSNGKSQMEIISNCGHVPHREQPDLILNLVNDFLKIN